METTITDRKQEVAALTGLAVDQIGAVKFELDHLRKNGLLIDLNISGTSMFIRSTTWIELGIQDIDDPRTSRFTKGSKFLIPEDQIKKLRSIETQMRSLLDGLSFDVTGFRPYRWLPVTAYEKFREKWAELTERFNQAKQEIIDNYDGYRDLVYADFRLIAEAAWKQIEKQGYSYAIVSGKALDRNEFIQAIIQDALAKFPSINQVENDLKCDYVTALLYGQEELEAEKLRTQQLQNQVYEERQKRLALEHDERLRMEREREQLRHEAEINRLAEEEKNAKIMAMWEAELQHAKEQLNQIASPLDEVFNDLRRRISGDVESMLESIKKNGYLKGKVAEKGKGLLDLFDLMAAHDDKQLRAKLVELRQAIGPDNKSRADGDVRSTEEIVSILNQIGDLTSKAVKDTMNVSRARFVE